MIARLVPTFAFALAVFIPVAMTPAQEFVAGQGNEQNIAAAIDFWIAAKWEEQGITPAPAARDREFCRRIYLDLAGRIPTIAELEDFLADERADRRMQLVKQLTSSEDYVQHFADVFDILLMGRWSEQEYQQRKQHGWRAYLENVFRDDRPWDQVARELVIARPTSEQDAGASWFLYERKDKHQAIAEAVAPALFGFRIECAQCHDHPLADEILQAHYWGLVAFFNRSTNANSKNGPRVGESAIGGYSEFADLTGDSQPNLLAFLGAEVVNEARPEGDAKQEEKDELYVAAMRDGDPRVPKFSRREAFANQVVREHPMLARAMVNRVWAMLMGRGLVHPFDEMDSMHPPSHPELLDWLAKDYQESGFDFRRLVSGICSSRVYGLSSQRPDDGEDPALFSWAMEKPLTAEQLARSIQQSVRGEFSNDSPLIAKLRQRLVEVLPDQSVTTVKEALFLSNNEAINDFLATSNQSNHLIPELIGAQSTDSWSKRLFQTMYSRLPDVDEERRLAEYLSVGNPSDRLQQVVWAMLTSAEFRFNH